MIWGGLNGIGMIVYKFWREMNWHWRMLLLTLITASLITVRHYFPLPVWNLFAVWCTVIWCGSLIRYVWFLITTAINKRRVLSNQSLITSNRFTNAMATTWAVLQTFTFITFTRLFFRSGSNLDPATANQEAWETAQQMVNQIGGAWNASIIPQVLLEYDKVFLLFIIGMAIHWLPDKFKRWYRINFAMMPIWVIALVCVVVVFAVYQFITADLQAFIYFQF